jgi:plasmid stabilization system protein ParE
MPLDIIFLPSARLGLQWFRIYYEQSFPEGMAKANARFEKCIRLLSHSPGMGRPAGKPPRRRFSIPDTPYTVVYLQRERTLEVIQVLDQRSEDYLKELFDP